MNIIIKYKRSTLLNNNVNNNNTININIISCVTYDFQWEMINYFFID